mmetsp:Transcript_4707/g.10028  ORF Transcript_4707/g.10028 Transcript_4707/m.10028 type:complete len:154 (+) Transcript_4707:109-570(+)
MSWKDGFDFLFDDALKDMGDVLPQDRLLLLNFCEDGMTEGYTSQSEEATPSVQNSAATNANETKLRELYNMPCEDLPLDIDPLPDFMNCECEGRDCLRLAAHLIGQTRITSFVAESKRLQKYVRNGAMMVQAFVPRARLRALGWQKRKEPTRN